MSPSTTKTTTYPLQDSASTAPAPATVAQQPGANTGMSVSPEAQTQERKAERLRGGCIPLPNGGRCWIIPIPCCC